MKRRWWSCLDAGKWQPTTRGALSRARGRGGDVDNAFWVFNKSEPK